MGVVRALCSIGTGPQGSRTWLRPARLSEAAWPARAEGGRREHTVIRTQDIRDWIRALRHQDAVLASEQDFRDRRKGSLQPGGHSGLSRISEIDGRIEFASGKTDLDGRPIVEEEEPPQE